MIREPIAQTDQYQKRVYRNRIITNDFKSYQVTIGETDLFIKTDEDLADSARLSILKYRSYIESYIKTHPVFLTSLIPLPKDDAAPDIVRDMLENSRLVHVGPMAAVAGAIAQYVGYDLLKKNQNVIIENGGDIFIKSKKEINVGIFAGASVLSDRVRIRLNPDDAPIGLCTSSRTVGPSLSFGNADAVTVKAKSSTLADAAATAIGNGVRTSKDIKKMLERGMAIPGVLGIVIILGNHLGVAGDIELL
jgi:ApbE superfamily uncharacterized protein (UPF0280 family)